MQISPIIVLPVFGKTPGEGDVAIRVTRVLFEEVSSIEPGHVECTLGVTGGRPASAATSAQTAGEEMCATAVQTAHSHHRRCPPSSCRKRYCGCTPCQIRQPNFGISASGAGSELSLRGSAGGDPLERLADAVLDRRLKVGSRGIGVGCCSSRVERRPFLSCSSYHHSTVREARQCRPLVRTWIDGTSFGSRPHRRSIS